MKLNKNAFKCNLIATTWPVDQNFKKKWFIGGKWVGTIKYNETALSSSSEF